MSLSATLGFLIYRHVGTDPATRYTYHWRRCPSRLSQGQPSLDLSYHEGRPALPIFLNNSFDSVPKSYRCGVECQYPTGPSCNITVFADTFNLRPSVFSTDRFLPPSLLAIAFIFPQDPKIFSFLLSFQYSIRLISSI